MRVHVMDLGIGDRLKNDTFNSYGLHVLSRGTVLSSQEISKLILHQVEYVDVEPSEPVEPATPLLNTLTVDSLQSIKPLFDHSILGTSTLFEEALENGYINDEIVQDTFIPLTNEIKDQRDVVNLLLMLNGKNDYTLQHSIQVGLLSYFIATWMGYAEEEAQLIGKAGYLHDIGKCRIDDAILYKPGRLNDYEFRMMTQHTIHGYEIIRNSIYPYSIAIVALQHHERMDGSGYPYHLLGSNIHPYSKIVGIADVYCAMITDRIYQQKRDLMSVLKELHEMSFAKLDPTITHIFISHMIPNFIGKNVLLNSGETGKIVMTNNSDYFRPLIHLNDRFVDLSMDHSLEITEIYM
ncbi:HD-GYP domain-containing protein [Paenibacillus terrigena]|uniref:HD-GYP domain-containing protein n=1 Tax=Paenibacillus terrigena TaxID=369333 RepID=UPI0028D66A8E|nr:HD-GYP domain-containing protein [Paenibacillus terrigena]